MSVCVQIHTPTNPSAVTRIHIPNTTRQPWHGRTCTWAHQHPFWIISTSDSMCIPKTSYKHNPTWLYMLPRISWSPTEKFNQSYCILTFTVRFTCTVGIAYLPYTLHYAKISFIHQISKCRLYVMASDFINNMQAINQPWINNKALRVRSHQSTVNELSIAAI